MSILQGVAPCFPRFAVLITISQCLHPSQPHTEKPTSSYTIGHTSVCSGGLTLVVGSPIFLGIPVNAGEGLWEKALVAIFSQPASHPALTVAGPDRACSGVVLHML